MVLVHFSVASNIDPARHIPAGLRALDQEAPIQAASPFWVTPAIDRPEQPTYWNGVVAARTDLDPDGLAAVLRRIESDIGRVRGADKWAARQLDLDILLWDGRFLDDATRREVADRPWLSAGLGALGVPDGDPHAADAFPVAPWSWPGPGANPS
jgi:2-amino-4-hydroxy-6-hydroxymethyldihydropteridine diphosphokinase